MDCSTLSFPILHHLLEIAQTHVHRVCDAIKPSHFLVPPSPPAFNLPQHQGLFHFVGSSHQVAKVLELQLQHQSFQWILRTDFLQDWLVWSPCCPRDSQESSPALQFESINSLALRLPYGPTLISILTTGKTIALTIHTFVSKVMYLLFNMLSRFIIVFLPRSNFFLNFMAAVTICSDFEAQEDKICNCFHFFPIYLPWSDGTSFRGLSFFNVEF